MDINSIPGLKANLDNLLELRGQKLRVNREKSLANADKVIKDLKETRNWSWYKELEYRNSDNLDSVALFYRGNEITYREMFDKMQQYAKSLKAAGIKKGDEIPVCMSNSPEFVYLLGAVSMIGAKANMFSEYFDEEYIKTIIDDCNSSFIFIEDNKYGKIKDIIARTKVDKIVMQSLGDSLPNGNNPYAEFDKNHGDLFISKVSEYKKLNSNVISIHDFEKIGNNYQGKIIDDSVTLDDEFTITYSSGTTSHRPKGIVHAVRSFNGVTRFHDSEVNHTPSYRRFSMQANIPTYSSTGLISGISDALTQGCKLALEPIYDENFVVESLLINKPSYLDFTKSFWLKFAKEILYNPKYKDVKLPWLTICFSVGERTDLNEEKLINKALAKVHAGRDLIPLPFPFIKLSTAGGDCEHGGIFYKLLRFYSNLNPVHRIMKMPAGLETFDAVDVAVLDENGRHCRPYKVGSLVAKSYFDMVGYKNNEDATNAFYVEDANGKRYGTCSATAFMDFFGDIHFKERKEKGKVSTSEINASVLRNLNCVLTSEVKEIDGMYVVHVEFMPGNNNVMKNLLQIERRIIKELGPEIASKTVYRLHSNKESFKLTHSGKRDGLALEEEGISDTCMKPYYHDGDFYLEAAQDFMNYNSNGPKKYVYQK